MDAQPPPDTIASFPTRPLVITPPRVGGGWFRALLGFLVVALLAIAPAAFFGPSVARDWVVADAAVPVQGGRVVGGSCKSYIVFINICDGHINAPGKDGGRTASMNYAFLSVPGGTHYLTVMQSTADPTYITTNLGLYHVLNRALLLAGWVVLFTCLAFLLLATWWREQGRLRRVAAMGGQGLRAMGVKLIGMRPYGRKLREWTIGYDDGGPRTARWNMRLPDQPFALPGDGWILAVRGAAGGVPFPLDETLAWVDLTDAERQRIHAARAREWSPAPAATGPGSG